jgi:primosomal protein N' (replication factor Y)
MVAGTAQDYDSFYRQEIDFRKELQYPPYAQFLKLTTTGPDEDRAMKVAEQIAAAMESALGENQHKIEIIGPYVAPVAKIGDVFRVHMLLRGKNLSAAKQLLIDQGIVGMRNVIIDVDPLGMM